MRGWRLALLGTLVAIGCRSQDVEVREDDPVRELAAALEGRRTWSVPTRRDPRRAGAFSAELTWTQRADGPWLRVDWFVSFGDVIWDVDDDGSSRREMVRLVPSERGVRAELYALPSTLDDLSPDGRWGPRSAVEPEDVLVPVPGCTMEFERTDDGWIGTTIGESCHRALSVEAYIRTTYSVFEDCVRIDEQGFGDAGQELWHSTYGPFCDDVDSGPSDSTWSPDSER